MDPTPPPSAAAGRARMVMRDSATGAMHVDDRRRVIVEGALGLAEHIALSAGKRAPSGYTSRLRIALTYLGAARWSVGRTSEIIDANRTLVLHAGDVFDDRYVGRGGGRACVLLTPAPAVADELLHGAEPMASRALSLPATMRLRLLTHHLLAIDAACSREGLLGDELMVTALNEALAVGTRKLPSRSSAGVIDRAKELLHAQNRRDVRLDQLARATGCSAVYLTQLFRRVEGVPLYRYHLRLRLTEALIDLPDADDLTSLALEHGFSSHSHFTSAFHTAFGVTPSHVRADLRARAVGRYRGARGLAATADH